jgi:hypothetical protein
MQLPFEVAFAPNPAQLVQNEAIPRVVQKYVEHCGD